MKKIKLLCAAGLLGALAMTSCTDLTEKVYSDLVRDNYYTDKLSVEAAVVRCFEHSDNVTWRGDIWKLQELTGDHFVWTQKGRHGYDDGQWIRLHEHKWNYIQGQINGAWVASYQCISQVNTVLRDFNTVDFSAIGVTDEEKAAIIVTYVYCGLGTTCFCWIFTVRFQSLRNNRLLMKSCLRVQQKRFMISLSRN